jgi:hypothetical protein
MGVYYGAPPGTAGGYYQGPPPGPGYFGGARQPFDPSLPSVPTGGFAGGMMAMVGGGSWGRGPGDAPYPTSLYMQGAMTFGGVGPGPYYGPPTTVGAVGVLGRQLVGLFVGGPFFEKGDQVSLLFWHVMPFLTFTGRACTPALWEGWLGCVCAVACPGTPRDARVCAVTHAGHVMVAGTTPTQRTSMLCVCCLSSVSLPARHPLPAVRHAKSRTLRSHGALLPRWVWRARVLVGRKRAALSH